MSPYFGSIDYMRATNFAEFKHAMPHWGAPTENQVYADTNGNIGWVPGGLAPIRPNWDGLLPVPATAATSGRGSGRRPAALQSTIRRRLVRLGQRDEPAGRLSRTASASSVSSGPIDVAPPRIDEVLRRSSQGLDRRLDAAAERRAVDPGAAPGGLARAAASNDPTRAAALELLRGWDAVECAESPQAALFEVWCRATCARPSRRAVLEPKPPRRALGADHRRHAERAGAAGSALRPPCDMPSATRLLLTTLGAAYAELEKLAGPRSARPGNGASCTTVCSRTRWRILGDGHRAPSSTSARSPRRAARYTLNQSSYRAQRFPPDERPLVPAWWSMSATGTTRARSTRRAVGRSGQPALPRPGGGVAVRATISRCCTRAS